MMEEICWTTFRRRILKDQFRFQRSLVGALSCTRDTVFTRKSAASSHQQYVALDQAPQWRKKTKNRLKQYFFGDLHNPPIKNQWSTPNLNT